MREETKKLLGKYLDSNYPIIYINHSDFIDVDNALSEVLEIKEEKIYEFSNAFGTLNFKTKNLIMECNLEDFLKNIIQNQKMEAAYILKDIYENMKSPKIIDLFRHIAEAALNKKNFRSKILIVSSKVVIPPELENFIILMDVPLPDNDEITTAIKNFSRENNFKLDNETTQKLIFSLKGLNSLQIEQVLSLAYQIGGELDISDKSFILGEKEQIIKKSGILELVNFDEKIDDIGGLENLKKWLKGKAEIFSALDEAIKFGVDIPNGILILGMPGCGKSLAAKATARLFDVPLIRLDIGRLMGKFLGESEANMRRALKLSENVSPCVLWIDELEKAFVGINGGNQGGETATRLFGNFLTWMQEKESTVFIVATANKISNLPPEFLRKGRFDELFFVDFPNENERKKIIEIHMKKRKKFNNNIDLDLLSKRTDGFSGADLESIVKDSVEKAFINFKNGKKSEITTEFLLDSIKNTKSISEAQKENIKKLKDSLREYDIKKASQSE